MLDHNPPELTVGRRGLSCEIVSGVAATDPAFWQSSLPGEAEGYAYHAACEATGEHVFKLGAAVVRDGARILAVCPVFRIDYRMNTSLQGTARSISEAIDRRLGTGVVKLLGLGSPYADTCAIAVEPGLDASARRLVFETLIDGIEAYAAANRIKMIAIKDLPEARVPEFVDLLRARKFGRIGALPNCILDLECEDVEGYLATLSRPTRKDIRRKLKSAEPVRIERRTDISDIKETIRALHEATRAASSFDYGDFESLPDRYFECVSSGLGGNALFLLYWVGDELAGFNLLLLSKDRAVDKFLGMRKDLAEGLNLYAVSWMENVKFCLERGIHTLIMGPTAYELKMRFGCRLQESGIWFRHRGPVANSILRRVAPLAAFDRFEPELVEWRKRKKREAREALRKRTG